jgi:hypothetical protein
MSPSLFTKERKLQCLFFPAYINNRSPDFLMIKSLYQKYFTIFLPNKTTGTPLPLPTKNLPI